MQIEKHTKISLKIFRLKLEGKRQIKKSRLGCRQPKSRAFFCEIQINFDLTARFFHDKNDLISFQSNYKSGNKSSIFKFEKKNQSKIKILIKYFFE